MRSRHHSPARTAGPKFAPQSNRASPDGFAGSIPRRTISPHTTTFAAIRRKAAYARGVAA